MCLFVFIFSCKVYSQKQQMLKFHVIIHFILSHINILLYYVMDVLPKYILQHNYQVQNHLKVNAQILFLKVRCSLRTRVWYPFFPFSCNVPSFLTSEVLCCHPEETPGVRIQKLCRSSFHLVVSCECTNTFCAGPEKASKAAWAYGWFICFSFPSCSMGSHGFSCTFPP